MAAAGGVINDTIISTTVKVSKYFSSSKYFLSTLLGLSAFQARLRSRWLAALCRFLVGESSIATAASSSPGSVAR